MAYRTLEVTLISAKDLNNVNLFTKMEVYAIAMLVGDARSKKKTPVDKEGGRNPAWNSTLKFNVMDSGADRGVLHIVLKSERAMGDREIGEVHVPIRELLDGWNKAAAAAASNSGGNDGKKSAPPVQFVSYQVRNNSGKAKGVLNLSYKFGDLVTVPTPPPPQYNANYARGPIPAYPPPAGPAYPPPMDPATAYPPHYTKAPSDSKGSEPVTAYPAGAGTSTAYPPPGAQAYPPQAGYGYPPPPQAGYGYPPPSGYGYPPQQAGYGYPPQQPGYGYPPQQGGYGYGAPPQVVQPQQGKKSKLGGGAGLGIGLLGGALGGMILGDMISDDSAYDAGYDAGFDDGGFGF